jgi:small subunit ribosomal protein S18
MAKQRRVKNKDNARRSKKKVSLLNQEQITYVDWKDVNLLRRFMSDRAKIRARRVTGNSAQQQREIAMAIKNAREMALLPYTSRVTTQRTSRDRGERGPRADAPMPMPTPATPPPTAGAGAEDGEELDTGFEAPDEFGAEVEAVGDVAVEDVAVEDAAVEDATVGAPEEG